MEETKRSRRKKSLIHSITEFEKTRLIGMVGDGMSWNQISIQMGIPASTVRRWALDNGYDKEPSSVKRHIVDRLVNQEFGITEHGRQLMEEAVSTGNKIIDDAATKDARDMMSALIGARKALNHINAGLDEMGENKNYDAKTLKLYSEGLLINVTTIRRIRGLDAANQQQEIIVTWDNK